MASLTALSGQIAVECFRRPNLRAVWSDEQQVFICPEETQNSEVSQQNNLGQTENNLPAINPLFKLVFITMVSAAFLSFIVCIGTTLYFGERIEPNIEKLVDNTWNVFFAGFGAVIGMLGTKAADVGSQR